MTLKELVPWRFGSLRRWDEDERAFPSFRRDFNNLHRDMDRLLDEFFRGSPLRTMQMPDTFGFGEVMPTIDVAEDDKMFRISVELPGMDEKDIDVTLAEGLEKTVRWYLENEAWWRALQNRDGVGTRLGVKA